MKFDITLEDNDLIDFETCLSLDNPEQRKQWTKQFYLFFVMAIIATTYIYYGLLNNFSIINLIIGFIISSIITVIITYFLLGLTCNQYIVKYYRHIRKKYKFWSNKNLTLEFLPEEIRYYSDLGTVNFLYTDINRLLQDKEHIYLFTDLGEIILPIRCLNGQENELLNFIQYKIQ